MFNSSDFVGHENCPQCGSRDNLGRYSDGHAWCFGCGYHEVGYPKGATKPVEVTTEEEATTPLPKPIQLPVDASSTLPAHILRWLASYGITIKEMVEHRFMFSAFYNQLIYPIYEGSHLLAYQARNFGGGKRKYYNKGSLTDILDIIYADDLTNYRGNAILLVEDKISAIKCGRYIPTQCLYGSNSNMLNFMRLQHIFDKVLIWLDPDKSKEAVGLAVKARSAGMQAQPLASNQDPKEHDDDFIKEILRGV